MKRRKRVKKPQLLIFTGIAFGILLTLGLLKSPMLVKNISLPINQPETSVVENEIKTSTKEQFVDIECGNLSRSSKDKPWWFRGTTQFGFGKDSYFDFPSEVTENLNQSLRLVLERIPPDNFPDIVLCFGDKKNIVLTQGDNYNDKSDYYVLVLGSEYSSKHKIKLKIEDGITYRDPVILGLSENGNFYIKVFGRDEKIYRTVESVIKINVNTGSYQTVGRSLWQENPQNNDPIPDSVFDPIDRGTTSNKHFKRTENLMINGDFKKELNDIPESDLIEGNCGFYGYNAQSQTFKARGNSPNSHPRYGGYWAPDLDDDQSAKLLASLWKIRNGISDKIGYLSFCDLKSGNKIVISEPSKHQSNKDIYVGLLDNDYGVIGKVALKAPADSYLISVDPIAFTTSATFYLKLSGQFFGGDVNLFKINFSTNSYSVLYQGR